LFWSNSGFHFIIINAISRIPSQINLFCKTYKQAYLLTKKGGINQSCCKTYGNFSRPNQKSTSLSKKEKKKILKQERRCGG
jgi:hypothetical protein